MEKTNSITSWSPNDYAAAAGRSNTCKLPNAMDFMSRLDSDVSAIDFNSSLVKIHKRERSPTSLTASTSSNSTELSKKKKYKLVDNTSLTKPQLSASTSSKLNSFSFGNKANLSSGSEDNKKAPEERLEFLKVVSAFVQILI